MRRGDHSGGRITVWMDPSVSPYLGVLRFSNKGTFRGRDVKLPEIHDTTVPALWYAAQKLRRA